MAVGKPPLRRWSRRGRAGCRLIIALAVVGAGLACTSDPAVESSSGQEPFPSGTITSPPTSEALCGEYRLELRAEGAPDRYVQEHHCLQDAFAAGTPAVLIQHGGTVEGDPIRQQFRVRGVGQLEVVSDYTRDRFGSGTIHVETCYELVDDHGRIRAEDCHDEPSNEQFVRRARRHGAPGPLVG